MHHLSHAISSATHHEEQTGVIAPRHHTKHASAMQYGLGGSVNDMHHQPPTLRWTKRERRDLVIIKVFSFPFLPFAFSFSPSMVTSACIADSGTRGALPHAEQQLGETSAFTTRHDQAFYDVSPTARGKEQFSRKTRGSRPTFGSLLVLTRADTRKLRQLRTEPYLLRTVGCRGIPPHRASTTNERTNEQNRKLALLSACRRRRRRHEGENKPRVPSLLDAHTGRRERENQFAPQTSHAERSLSCQKRRERAFRGRHTPASSPTY
jgi:hypothetical protein